MDDQQGRPWFTRMSDEEGAKDVWGYAGILSEKPSRLCAEILCTGDKQAMLEVAAFPPIHDDDRGPLAWEQQVGAK